MPICGFLNCCRLLYWLVNVTQRWIETILVGNVFNCAHLIVWIDICKSTAHSSTAIGNFGVGTINVTGITTGAIAKGVWTGWRAGGGMVFL
jgi:hypothetical protein